MKKNRNELEKHYKIIERGVKALNDTYDNVEINIHNCLIVYIISEIRKYNVKAFVMKEDMIQLSLYPDSEQNICYVLQKEREVYDDITGKKYGI